MGCFWRESDPGDSYKLADYLRTDGHRLRRLEPIEPGLRELQALVRLRDDQVRARNAATTQLAATLDAHWPGPRDLFCSLASPIALAFLADYPSPQAAAHLGDARMGAFCRRHAYRGGKSPAELLARLRAAPAAPIGLAAATLSAIVAAQVDLLRALQAAITDIERVIADRVAAHPVPDCSNTCPASAPSTWLNCSPNSDPSSIASTLPNKQPPNAGLRRSPRPPAKTTGVYFRSAANKRARKAITAFAHNSRMQSRWAATLYADARTRGKRNPHAIRILARAWIRIIWTCWHSGIPYDPTVHQARQRIAA